VSPADTVTYESVRLPLAGTIATNAVAAKFGTSLLPGQLRVEEEAFVGFVPPPNTPLSMIPGAVDCAGFQDEIALLSDGSVTVLRRTPTKVGDNCKFVFDAQENAAVQKKRNFLTGVKALGRGTQVAYAILNDGTVVGWGENYCGSLAPNLPNRIYAEPQVIPGLRDVTAISQSSSGAIARDKSGSVFYWGSNGNPQLTDGVLCDTAKWQHSRIQQTTLANAVETHAAGNNFFALTADGVVYGWGEGFAGLLANSQAPATDFLRGPAVQNPTPIPGLGKVRQLAFLELTAFALQVDGAVLAWGEDDQRLLGGGTVQVRTPRPTPVAGLTGIATMVAASGGMRFQKIDGGALAWGTGLQGPNRQYYATPTPVTPPQRVRHLISRNAGYTVFYESGVVSRDLGDAFDVSPAFR
jgi:alpha-tubulin suppressor-like RCC1 family protein